MFSRIRLALIRNAVLIRSLLFILVRYIYGGITRLFWHLGQHRKANRNTLLADATADTETKEESKHIDLCSLLRDE